MLGGIIEKAMPVQGLIGGFMIGFASAIMLLSLGQIAGISGLAARAAGITFQGAPRSLAIAFVIGLPLGAASIALLLGPVETRFPSSVLTLIIGGGIVGFGTRLGSGCTSGHGVCGMSRFSRRSLVATATFMVAGLATVAIMRVLELGL